MKAQYRVRIKSSSKILSESTKIANSFSTRMIGLLGRKKLNKGEGLLLTKCNCVHMFFMRFAIDVVFLDKDNTVVYISENLGPWRLSKKVSAARSALEIEAGKSASLGLLVGDSLLFENA